MIFVIHTVQILTINISPNLRINKIHSEESINFLHVPAPGCHNQGVILNKDVQDQSR
jgi:hypothetical protein